MVVWDWYDQGVECKWVFARFFAISTFPCKTSKLSVLNVEAPEAAKFDHTIPRYVKDATEQ